MQISGLGANPLLSLGARPSTLNAQSFSLQTSSANFSTENAKSLPPVQPIALSMEALFALQGEQEDKPQATEPKAPTAEELFLQEARKSPMERMREQVMKELGVSEDALAAMPAEERRAAEDKIREMIGQKLKEGLRENGGGDSAEGAGQAVMEAALG